MSVANDDLVTSICDLARRYYLVDDASIYELTRATGYFESHASVTVQDLAKELEDRPEAIRHWFQYSQDKRTSDGWFVLEERGGYTVGSVFGGREVSGMYGSAVDACAVFIKNELEAIRLS